MRPFLSAYFLVAAELNSKPNWADLIHHHDVELLKKLKIKLISINEGLDVAEIKQFQNSNVKNWLDDSIHEGYEVEQLLDVMETSLQQNFAKFTTRFIFSPLITRRRFESRIKVLLRRLEFLADQKVILGLQELTSGDYEIGVSRKLLREFRTVSLVDESVIYSREHEKEEIVNFLLSDSDNRVPIISIVILIGIGKTTLAQLVYNDHRMVDQFELKAWVHVSESFDLVSLTQSILRSFDSSAEDTEDFEILQRQLQQLLTGKKYLLVLDGIWDIDENMWEQLLLLFKCGSSGSKMIVTTHDKEVASIVRSTQLLHLKQLEESDSWSLFVSDSNINSILRLSYLNLPSNLKRCFAYCSIFPKGYEFEKGELIKLWMAEGLLKRKYDGKIQNEESLGNEFFDHLATILFFQQSVITPLSAGKYYIMPDLVNDLAKFVSGKFRLRIEADNVQHIPQRTRHIWCCLDLEGGDRKLKQIQKIEGLYSLMVEAQGYGDQRFKISPNVQQSLFSRLKYLRMLSFSGCNLLELAYEIRNLKLLRYLDLSYTEIASLPNSICTLYNLQTLLLQGCFKLTEIPSDFYILNNIHDLNLEGTHLKKMPTKIERLNNLEMLTDFFVGEQRGFDIKQLGKLNQLQGRLRISGLENVNDPAHAVEANMADKEDLEELSMSYDEWREIDGSVMEAQVSVLEALQPNRNLMRLTIKDYRGSSFPNWLGGHHLPNLASLELLGCKLLSQLPPLEQFPSLKKLSISGCNGIDIIGTEFCGYNSSNVPFRSLETLRFEYMSEWKEWLCLEAFPLLQELCIKHCPKLKSTLPQHLPSLQKLEIIDCQELSASIPKAANITELELKRCDDILITELPSTLKRVILCGTQVIQSSLEQILYNSAFLEELEVEDFFGPNLEWSSLEMCSCNSLRTITITGWYSSSLPFALHLFTNLHSLVLYDCPWMESFFGRQLPFKLRNFRIERCPKLMASREEWGLFQLNSLKQFSVSDDFEILESFPEESLLPSSINSLELTNCSNLRIINYKGLLHLTSLESLYIEDCPCLESLPEEGLSSSLSTLSIHDCPLLKTLYQKEEGERWHTISHIPSVTIS